ncbi:4'-phosphopantetheinyl transferase family protein [Oceanisphaera avium]|uniref:4'-phosphopantetheinyl transferase family protein n=1 Tax=Oceanisphaera avium TaxID=1903694 RepID=UPI0018E050FD|nr:4'-phosphopantetheinyl transferase superfamily protein [Oceanisphaera avium]
MGAITHSDSWAAAIVAKQAHYLGLGLDIERSLSPTDAEKLAPALLTPAELARLQELSPQQFAFMVTVSFSLKESLFKALYPLVKKHFYFEDAELMEWDIPAGSARLRLLSTLSSNWPKGRELAAQFCLYDDHIWSLVAIPNKGTRGENKQDQLTEKPDLDLHQDDS